MVRIVVAAAAVRKLLVDDSLVQARSGPADLSLEAETVVLQLGGVDDGVGGDHRAVAGLTALSRDTSHPLHLWTSNQLVLLVGDLLTLISQLFV